ncbi:MAG: FG-GAP repeat domain-containing protein [Pyrinomonadaceae bacterium]
MSERKRNSLERFGRLEQIAIAAFILLLAIGVFGASRLAERIINSFAGNPSNQTSQISSQPLNPVITGTPQLSKEYIYVGGSRLLVVEDANANAAPPADLAVWRPATGIWYVLGGSGSQQVYVQWGGSGDIPVPGDYDGDSKTDFSVFRPSEGNWYIQRSSDSSMNAYQFGLSNDKTAQADFDGDGRTDAAVFRPSNGTWYILRSSDGGMTSQQFGLSTDTPAAADFDGDGKADIGVWRDGSAAFYSLNSSIGGLQTINYGQAGDIPVCGDYDGDGRADYALKRGNLWLIRQSSNSQTQTITWEQTSDKTVQNDYDGDGKTDVAVWRESNGTWYIRNSANPGQPRIVQWGMAGDYPVPAFYRR